MKEDVLEQIVDDWLQSKGYLTTHNVPFKPSKDHLEYIGRDDSVDSDIDVVGINPNERGRSRVLVVSCKSWQGGFNATRKLAELRGEAKNPKRETWRHFRELWKPKWSEAFVDAVEERTGKRKFDYRIAVTKVSGDTAAWATDPTIAANLPGCSVGFLTLAEMWSHVLEPHKSGSTKPAPSEIGRLAQLLKAAELT